MISYAQNHEDVVLARIFAGQADGFYVDVGAEHPVFDSVTKHFYDLGWRGVNIEPSPTGAAELQRFRPGDITLGIGLSDFEGKAVFFEGPADNHGASSFREDIVSAYRTSGQTFVELRDVPVTTLAAVWEDYVGDRTVDFLKIDVEGLEASVIAGTDWERCRPQVVVVEATQPNTRTPSHSEWEPSLLAAGYCLTMFDGLNRFYVRDESPELLHAASYPACVFDYFTDARQLARESELGARIETQSRELEDLRACVADLSHLTSQAETIERLEAHLAEARSENVRLQAELAHAMSELRHWRRDARLARDDQARAEDEASRREASAEVLRDRLVAADRDSRRRADEAAAELDALRATRTFRWTASARSVYGMIRRLQRAADAPTCRHRRSCRSGSYAIAGADRYATALRRRPRSSSPRPRTSASPPAGDSPSAVPSRPPGPGVAADAVARRRSRRRRQRSRERQSDGGVSAVLLGRAGAVGDDVLSQLDNALG